jgi:hypothetical protein
MDQEMSDKVCIPAMDGQKLMFNIPVWCEEESDGEKVTDLAEYDMIELVYELKGEFDEASLLKGLTEGDLKFQTNLIV